MDVVWPSEFLAYKLVALSLCELSASFQLLEVILKQLDLGWAHLHAKMIFQHGGKFFCRDQEVLVCIKFGYCLNWILTQLFEGNFDWPYEIFWIQDCCAFLFSNCYSCWLLNFCNFHISKSLGAVSFSIV